MRKRIGDKWPLFLSTLRKLSENDDQDQIFIDDFSKVCLNFKIKLSESQLQNLCDSYPGRKEENRLRLNIGRFYDLNLSILQHNIYRDLEVRENQEEVYDACGYTGQMHRRRDQLKAITEKEFIDIVKKDVKIDEISRLLREIDERLTGFVTKTELEDIMKIVYEEELADKDLADIIQPFCSIINKIVVDYRAFKEYLNSKVKGYDFKQGRSSLDASIRKSQLALEQRNHSRTRLRSGSQTRSRDMSPMANTLQKSRDFLIEKSNHKDRMDRRKSSIDINPSQKKQKGLVTVRDLITDFAKRTIEQQQKHE